MPTVIDALLITLGLDAKGLVQGAEQAKKATKGVGDQTHATGKDMEAALRRMTDSWRAVRTEILSLMALITAGRGIKALVSDITTGDAALGKLAQSVDMSTKTLSEWQGAAVRAGGSAEGLASTAKNMTQAWMQLALTNNSSVVPYFKGVGVAFSDAAGKMRPLPDIWMDTAKRFKELKYSMPQAIAVGGGMGIDEGTVRLLMQGEDGIRKLLEEQKKLGTANDDDANRAQKLLNELANLRQAFENLVRRVLERVELPLMTALQKLDDWVKENGERITKAIADFITGIINGMQSFDWKGLATELQSLVTGANDIATALGGWKNASEALFAVWAASNVLKLVGGMGLIRGAMGLGGGAGAGLLRLLGGGAMAGAGLGYVFSRWRNDNGTETDMVGKGIQHAKRNFAGSQNLLAREDAEDYGYMVGSTPEKKPEFEIDLRFLTNWMRRAASGVGGAASSAASSVSSGIGRVASGVGGVATGEASGDAQIGFNQAEKEQLFRRFLEYQQEQARAKEALEAMQNAGNAPMTANDNLRMTGGAPNNRSAMGGDMAHPDAALSVNQQKAAHESYQFWIGKGFSPSGAAAMASAEMSESGGNPAARGDYVNGSATAFGLYQHHMDRVQKMYNESGIDVRTATAAQQREAHYREMMLGLDPQSGKAFADIKNATNPYAAGQLNSRMVERPGDPYGAVAATRGRKAMAIYAQENRPDGGTPRVPVAPVSAADGAPGQVVNMRQSHSSNETNIGNIQIHTQATDASGLANDLQSELNRRAFGRQADTGLR